MISGCKIQLQMRNPLSGTRGESILRRGSDLQGRDLLAHRYCPSCTMCPNSLCTGQCGGDCTTLTINDEQQHTNAVYEPRLQMH